MKPKRQPRKFKSKLPAPPFYTGVVRASLTNEQLVAVCWWDRFFGPELQKANSITKRNEIVRRARAELKRAGEYKLKA